MSNSIKKIGVLTSGGDAPGMNAAIRSVVRTCAFYDKECIGVYRGYQGMIEGDFTTLTARNINNIINKGGTILKSARSDEFRTPEGRKKAFKQLKDNNIDGLVVIGGDGSFTGGVVFNKEYNFPVIGIPGTIDNDIYNIYGHLVFSKLKNVIQHKLPLDISNLPTGIYLVKIHQPNPVQIKIIKE